jgi:hypothetical protein
MSTDIDLGKRKMIGVEEDVHARLVKRGRYDQTMSDIIREILDALEKFEKGKK